MNKQLKVSWIRSSLPNTNKKQ